MTRNPRPGSKEESELELLGLVIEAYERKNVPPANPDPVDAILFRMDQLKLKRKDLVPYLGSISKVSEVLSRKRPLSLSMIRRLHEGLAIPTDILIGKSSSSDAEENVDQSAPEDYSKLPLKEMRNRGCFPDFKGSLIKLKENAQAIVEKLVRELTMGKLQPVLLRAPLHQRGVRVADPFGLLAWRLCVLRKARRIPNQRPYRKGTITLKWLRDLAKLSSFENGPVLAQEYLHRYGITLVIEPHFDKTFLDGAALLDNGRPIVGLTLRHDRVDNFWFALMHEMAHVWKHLDEAHPQMIDNFDNRDHLDGIEEQADKIATDALIPEDAWNSAAVRRTRKTNDATALAHKLGIHPAIVAGRIRWEAKDYRLLSHLVGKGKQVSRCFDESSLKFRPGERKTA